MEKIILVDIDGTVNSYPKCFLDWVKHDSGVDYLTIEEMKKQVGITSYQHIKYKYRMSGIKRELPVYPSSTIVLKSFKDSGWQVWFYTTRPKIKKVMVDTRFWLNKHFSYNQLFFVDDKKRFLNTHVSTISLLIDDDPEIIEYVNNGYGCTGMLVNDADSWQ